MNGSEKPNPSVAPQPSPVQSVRQLAGILLAIFRNRAELLTLELQEEQGRLINLVFLLVTAISSLIFAAILGTFFIIVLFWDTPYRLVVMGIVVAFFAVTAIISALLAMLAVKGRPPLFGATLGEIRKDAAALRQEMH